MKKTLLSWTLIGGALPVAIGLQPADAGTNDYFLSVPFQGSIERIDQGTLQASPSPFLVGLHTPFYGYHDQNGDLLIPDHVFGGIVKIDPLGQGSFLTAGGWLTSPLAVIDDPQGYAIAADKYQRTIVRVDSAGNQTLVHDATTSGGLLLGPGGLAFDPDGNLYIGNNFGDTILKMDPQGNLSVFSASSLIQTPGGIVIDGSGNMFVSMYDGNRIVRFRLDTGEAESFAQDLALMVRPSDLKLTRGGRLLTTTRLANLVSIDALGNVTELFKNVAWGDILGVSRPDDWAKCTGRILEVGVGTKGTGGFVPEMHGLFSPCPGEAFALEWKGFNGNAPAILAVGLAPANVPAFGGTLMVDLSPPGLIQPIVLPGTGPGGGELTIEFTLPANPSLTGLSVYLQTLAADAGAPAAVALSNGLQMIVGS